MENVGRVYLSENLFLQQTYNEETDTYTLREIDTDNIFYTEITELKPLDTVSLIILLTFL